MIARCRVVVPDRPGSLGVLASAVGSVGADVCGVRVLGSEGGRTPEPPAEGHTDLALAAQVMGARGPAAAQVLVDGAPAPSSGGDGAGTALVPVPGAPSSPSSSPPSDSLSGGGRAPVGLVLVRETGLGFHRGELWRLGAVAEVVAGALARAAAPGPGPHA